MVGGGKIVHGCVSVCVHVWEGEHLFLRSEVMTAWTMTHLHYGKKVVHFYQVWPVLWKLFNKRGYSCKCVTFKARWWQISLFLYLSLLNDLSFHFFFFALQVKRWCQNPNKQVGERHCHCVDVENGLLLSWQLLWKPVSNWNQMPLTFILCWHSCMFLLPLSQVLMNPVSFQTPHKLPEEPACAVCQNLGMAAQLLHRVT